MLLMVFDEFNDLLFTSLDKYLILNASRVSVKTLIVLVRLIVCGTFQITLSYYYILLLNCILADSVIGREVVAIVHHDNLSLELMVDEKTLWTGQVYDYLVQWNITDNLGF